MNLPNNHEILTLFTSFLVESGLSSVSIKNYLSDIRHFLRFLETKNHSDLNEVFQNLSKHIKEYTLEQKTLLTPTATTNRRLASIRRLSTFLQVKYQITDNSEISTPNQNTSSLSQNNQSHLSPTIDNNSSISSKKILDQFRQHLINEKKTHSTVKNYLSDLYHYFSWIANQTPYNTHHLAQILSNEQLQGYITYQKLTQTSTSVINRRQSSIKKLTHYCFAQGYIPSDPFEMVIPSVRIAPLSWLTRLIPKAKSPQNPSKSRLAIVYHKYNALPFTPYLHLALLVLATTTMAILGYNQIIKQASPSQAATSLTPPKRQLSFQGRLSDSAGTPITTAVNVTFKLWNNLTAGSQLYTTGTCSITPDQDGIFNSLIGDGVCGTEIPQSVFTDNRDVFLAVTVGAETLTPRQQIATVGYALNSETLQGYPASAAATINTVPVVDNSGNINIAATSPAIVSTSGNFNIKGQSLSLTTALNSGGDIVLQPDALGSGQILAIGGTTTEDSFRITNANLTTGSLLSGYIGNDTATSAGRLLSLTGGATETDRFYVGADGSTKINTATDSSGISALIVNQNTANGNLFSASASGISKFTIDSLGRVSLIDGVAHTIDDVSGNLTLTSNSSTISLNDNVSFAGTTTLNSQTYTWPASQTNNYVLQTNGSGTLTWVAQTTGSTQLWDQQNGTLYPLNSTVDFLLGGQASSSAKFAVLNMNTGTPVASISANSGNNTAYLTGDGTLGTTNRSSLTLGNSSTYNTTGNLLIHPNGTGNIGIGTMYPSAKLEVVGQPTTGNYRNIYATYDDTSSLADHVYGANISVNVSGNTASNRVAEGIYSLVQNYNSTDIGSRYTKAGYFSGMGSTNGTSVTYGVDVSASGGDTVYGGIYNTSGSSTNTYGLFVKNSPGAVSNAYGMYIESAYNDGEGFISLDNNYGLYLAPQTLGSTTNYNLYSAGATSINYVEGLLGIGDTTPTDPLTVGDGDLFKVSSAGIITGIDGVAHTIDDVGGNLTLTSNSTAISFADDIYLSSGLSTYSTAVTDGTIEAIKFCTGDGETNCVTDFSSLVSGSAYWTLSAGVLSPTALNNAIAATTSATTALTLTQTGAFNALLVQDQASDTTPFVIDQSGNVGIGTTSPIAKLHTNIDGGVATTSIGSLIYSPTTAGTFTDPYSSASKTRATFVVGSSYDNNSGNLLNVYSYSQDGVLFANGAGNVGIGTTSPTAKLDVVGDASVSASFVTRSATPTFDVLNGGNLVFQTSPGGDAGLTTKMTLANNGNLTVTGTISAADFSCTDCLDFTELADTLALDAALILNQSTNTWTQNFTGTTTDGFTYNANSLTSGDAVNIFSTSTALTTGNLLGLDWSPGSATTATGDLFSLNIGTNGTIGNLFNIKDTNASIFSVSETAVTANLPTSFTSAGDVSIAYDLNFTNPTTSSITSSAPLSITAGETFNSSNLTLKTYNSGDIVLDAAGGITLNQAQAWDIANSSTTSLNFESGLLNLDTTNSRVGIGNSAPGATLDVTGHIRGTAINVNGVTALGAGLTLSDEGTYKRIQSYELEPLSINPLGNNVGIGTTSPTAILDVAGDASFSASLITRSATPTFDILNGGNLVFQTSPGGDAGLTARMTLANNGNLSGLTGLTSSGTINFSGLTSLSAVYTDGAKNLTSTAPTSGALGYWQRNEGANGQGSISPTNLQDSINIGSLSTASAQVHLSASTVDYQSFIVNPISLGFRTAMTNPGGGVGFTMLQVDGDILPLGNSGGYLGRSSTAWKKLYLAEGINDDSGTEKVSIVNSQLAGTQWNVSGALRVGDTTNSIPSGLELYVTGASGKGDASISGTLGVGDLLTVSGNSELKGDVTINGGSGKLNVGTVDPPYTINGEKYATYMPGMIGVKEEVTGIIATNEYIEGLGYRKTINFNNQTKGSDLWLFGKTTNIKQNISRLSVLLSPKSQSRTWYELDETNNTLFVYSSSPTEISYRFTAPRFDDSSWANTRNSGPDGFILNDPDTIQTDTIANINYSTQIANIDGIYKLMINNEEKKDISSFSNSIIANLKAGIAVVNEIVVNNLTINNKLISPLAQFKELQALNATISGSLYADNIKGKTIDKLNEQLNILDSKYSTASAILASLQEKYTNYNSLFGFTSLATSSAESDPLTLSPLATSSGNLPGDISLNSINVHTLMASDILANGSIFSQSLNSFDTDLYIQASGEKPVHILANLMTLYPNGQVLIDGDLIVTGNIFANNIDTRTATISGTLAVGNGYLATNSASILALFNESGDVVGSVDSAGAANFGELTTNGIIIASGAENSASISGQTASNSTIGTASIATGSSEIIIQNNKITADTLIYITPVSDTNNQVLFVKSKQVGSGFTVAVPQPVQTETSFNFWLVQTK